MLLCRVFVVIRNGMKSVFMCECDLYGWLPVGKGQRVGVTRGDLSDSVGILINI